MEHRQPGRSWPGREPVVGIGLMSGTSADGVDAVAVRLQEQTGSLGCELLAQVARPYPAALRSALFQCFSNSCDARHLCLLNAALGEFYADAAQEVVSQLPDVAVDFVACHGQTIWHETTPDAGVRAERPPFADPTLRATFQIGEAARIAERLGIPVVSDFRQQDLALGGEGAPLVPSVDYLLFRSPDRARAIQNLGGIGNVTYLPAGCGPEQVIAFDTGPANCWMDRAAERTTNGRWRFDLDGQLARAGKTDPGLLERLLDEERDFLERPPPKSTGRERYSTAAVDRLWEQGYTGPDLVATLTQFTVETIARSYRRWLAAVDEVVLGGGGARNPELVGRLGEALAPAAVLDFESLGVPAQAREALAFAVLGYQTLRGLPSSLPHSTGASRPAVQGKICLP